MRCLEQTLAKQFKFLLFLFAKTAKSNLNCLILLFLFAETLVVSHSLLLQACERMGTVLKLSVEVHKINWSADGKRIASGGANGIVNVYNIDKEVI